MAVQKPTEKCQVRALDYDECAAYIAEKLGYPSKNPLRNFGGDEYKDFWHLIIDQTDVGRGDVFWISSDHWDLDKVPEWARPIYDAFVDEFGPEATYWVDW